MRKTHRFLVVLSVCAATACSAPGIARLEYDGSPDLTFMSTETGFNGTVRAIVQQPDGKLIVGGDFSTFGGALRPHLARLNNDGTLDTSFDPGSGCSGPIYAILRTAQGELYVGGDFTACNSIVRGRIARLSASGALDLTFAPGSGFDALVRTIVRDPVSGGLYVGGDFNTYNGQSRNSLVRLHETGAVDQGFNLGTGFNGRVEALLQHDVGLVVGGAFTQFNGVSCGNIVVLHPSGVINTPFNAGTGFDQPVRALAEHVDGILVGGAFVSYGGAAQLGYALLHTDGTLNAPFNSDGGANGPVNTIVPTIFGIYVGGDYILQADGARHHLVRLNITTGAFDPTFNSEQVFNHEVHALVPALLSGDPHIVVGGATD